jgi:hypothetical protein
MAPPCQVCVRAARQVLCALVLIVLSFTAITVISTFESRSSGSSSTVLSSSAPPPLPSQGGHMLFRAALVPAWQRAFCHAQEPRP